MYLSILSRSILKGMRSSGLVTAWHSGHVPKHVTPVTAHVSQQGPAQHGIMTAFLIRLVQILQRNSGGNPGLVLIIVDGLKVL